MKTDMELITEGAGLSAPEYKRLVQKAESLSLKQRFKLVGYYFRKRKDLEIAPLRLKLILWFIDNVPEREVLSHMEFTLFYLDSELLEFEQHWIKQVESHLANHLVVGNAGCALVGAKFEIGEQLLKRAIQLNPYCERWLHALNKAYFEQVTEKDLSHERMREYCEAAIRYGDEYLKLDDGGYLPSVLMCLERGAQCALLLQDFNLVRSYASRIEKLYGEQDAPKIVDSLLGIAALREGKLALAKKHLFSMERQVDMNEFDRQMLHDLLNQGEKDTVIDYLKACEQKGIRSCNAVNNWIKQIQAHEQVNFNRW